MPRYWIAERFDREATAELHDILFGEQPGQAKLPVVDGRLGRWNGGCSAGSFPLEPISPLLDVPKRGLGTSSCHPYGLVQTSH